MMGRRGDKMRTADEYDAFTGWRRFIAWRSGMRAWIKRNFRRRERQVARRKLEGSR